MTCARAQEFRVYLHQRDVTRGCGPEKRTGEVVRVVQIAYTSQVVLLLDGVESHERWAGLAEDVSDVLVDVNLSGWARRLHICFHDGCRTRQKSQLQCTARASVMIINRHGNPEASLGGGGGVVFRLLGFRVCGLVLGVS